MGAKLGWNQFGSAVHSNQLEVKGVDIVSGRAENVERGAQPQVQHYQCSQQGPVCSIRGGIHLQK